MHLVNRSNHLLCWEGCAEYISKHNAVLFGHFLHRGHIRFNLSDEFSGIDVNLEGALVYGCRRHECDPWRAFAVVALLFGVLDPVFEIGLELLKAGLTGEGLVEAEEGDDNIGLGEGEVLVGRAEAFGAGTENDLIGGPGEVADDEVMLGEALMEERLPVVVTLKLHALGQRVADEADVVAGLELQRRGVGGGEGEGGEEERAEHRRVGEWESGRVGEWESGAALEHRGR